MPFRQVKEATAKQCERAFLVCGKFSGGLSFLSGLVRLDLLRASCFHDPRRSDR